MLLVHATENGVEFEETMYNSLDSRSKSETGPVARNNIEATCTFAGRRFEIQVRHWIVEQHMKDAHQEGKELSHEQDETTDRCVRLLDCW